MPVWKTWYWRLQNLNFPNHLILGTTLESDNFYFSRLWGKLGTPERDLMKWTQGESRLHNSQAHYAKVCHPILWWERIITTTSLLRTSRGNGHQLETVSSLLLPFYLSVGSGVSLCCLIFYLKIISYSIFWSYALLSPTPPWSSSPQYPSNFMFFLSQRRKKKNQNKQTKNNEMKPTKSMKSILYWPTNKGLVTPIMFIPLLSWIIVYIPRDILLEKTGGCHPTPCMPQLQTAS